MNLFYTIFMNRRDVTGWVDEITVEHPRRTLYRQWTFQFAAWAELEGGARWDVFATHDPTVPFAEKLVRGGVNPEDRSQARLVIQATDVPRSTVTGYDYVWLAQRRSPRETLVFAPSMSTSAVERALANYDGPVGRYQVIIARTMREAVTRLAAAAGVTAAVRLPDWDLQPFVVDPDLSYWDAILELIRPSKASVYYIDSQNTLVIADPTHRHYSIGGRLTLPAKRVKRIEGFPIEFARPKRVIYRVPSCR